MTLEFNTGSLQRLALLASMGILASIPAHRTSAARPTEYEVKAAYLFNFGRFVEWPLNAPSRQAGDFSICVLGHDPFGPALDTTISGQKIDGKTVVARRIPDLGEAATCRELFISASEGKQLKEIFSNLGKLSVLTVSDMPDFMQQGGMVQFVVADERVRFAVNLAATQPAGLNLSSELLKVAAEVRGTSRPGN
jgi:hypothetical protein